MRKFLDLVSILSFLISISMASGGLYAYLYIKNPENIEKTKGFVKKEIKKMLPDLLPEIPTNPIKILS